MQNDRNPERTSHIYFGIFLLLAVAGGWVIWQSNQWYEVSERRKILPAPQRGNGDAAIIYGRRGEITQREENFLKMENPSEKGSGKIYTVRRDSKTSLWIMRLDEDISFSAARWDDFQVGRTVFAVSGVDIKDRAEFFADRIYLLDLTDTSMAGVEEIIEQALEQGVTTGGAKP